MSDNQRGSYEGTICRIDRIDFDDLDVLKGRVSLGCQGGNKRKGVERRVKEWIRVLEGEDRKMWKGLCAKPNNMATAHMCISSTIII